MYDTVKYIYVLYSLFPTSTNSLDPNVYFRASKRREIIISVEIQVLHNYMHLKDVLRLTLLNQRRIQQIVTNSI